MRKTVFKTLLIGCLPIILATTIAGCRNSLTINTQTPVNDFNGDGSMNVTAGEGQLVGVVPDAPFYYDDKFNTGDSCNSRTLEVPADGLIHVEFTDGGSVNWIWGNVAKMWIYIDGKQVAYDVGRDVGIAWEGAVRAHTKVEFRACAETHGDDVTVYYKAYWVKWLN